MKLYVPHIILGGGFGPCRGLVKLGYLSWGASVSSRAWSHMCENWFFPKFLLSERSFTQIYIASFMFLVTPWDSLSTSFSKYGPMWGYIPFHPYCAIIPPHKPLIPKTTQNPYTPISVVQSLVKTHFYLCSLIFAL